MPATPTDAETWEEEKAYDEEIAPLMAQIIKVCNRAKIPCVASFAFRRDEAQIGYCTTSLAYEGRVVPAFGIAANLILNGIAGVAIAQIGPPPAPGKKPTEH